MLDSMLGSMLVAIAFLGVLVFVVPDVGDVLRRIRARIDWRRLVAWSHLVGGAFGLFVVIPSRPVGSLPPGVPFAWYWWAVALFALSTLSGVLNLGDRHAGRAVGVTVEALQAVQGSVGGWAFSYGSGLQVLLMLTPYTLALNFPLSSYVGLGLGGAESGGWYVAVDLFTPFAVRALLHEQRVRRARAV